MIISHARIVTFNVLCYSLCCFEGYSMHTNNFLTPTPTLTLTLTYMEQIFSHKNGEIMRSILSFDQNKRSLELQPMERSYLGFLTHAAQVQKSSSSIFLWCWFCVVTSVGDVFDMIGFNWSEFKWVEWVELSWTGLNSIWIDCVVCAWDIQNI